MVRLTQQKLLLLWVQFAKPLKRQLITSMRAGARLVFLRFTFTDHSRQNISLMCFPKLLRRLLFLTEQKSPVQLASLFSLMFAICSTERKTHPRLWADVMVLAQRIPLQLRLWLYSTTLIWMHLRQTLQSA